jgi:hypothetical protein
MCYTSKDSLYNYLINISVCFILYIYGNKEIKLISLFLLFVGQMQIFDYLFFNVSDKINYIITKIATIFNHLQPIVLSLLFYYYGFKQSNISLIILLLYCIFTTIYTFGNWNNVKLTKLDPIRNVLVWDWNKQPLNNITYFLFILYLTVASFNLKTTFIKIFFAAINIITYYLATKTPILNISIGRIWCYYASLLPVGTLVGTLINLH